MVEVRQLNDFELFLYSPDGQFLGILRHDSQLLDVLLQIRDEHELGYYLVNAENGEVSPINAEGRILDFTRFRNLNEELLTEFVGF